MQLLWWVNLLYHDTGSIHVFAVCVTTALVSMNAVSNHQPNEYSSKPLNLTIECGAGLFCGGPSMNNVKYRIAKLSTFIQKLRFGVKLSICDVIVRKI